MCSSDLVLPMEVLVIPLYIGANQLGLVDTYVALIMPFAFGAFGTFMLRQFLLSLPRDYEEAARIDGAGQLRILVSVIVPLLRGPLSIVAAFAFIDYWNNFLWPLIVINSSDKATIPLGPPDVQRRTRNGLGCAHGGGQCVGARIAGDRHRDAKAAGTRN